MDRPAPYVAPLCPAASLRPVAEAKQLTVETLMRWVRFAPPPLPPPHKGEGVTSASESPSPLWGGVRGGGHDSPDHTNFNQSARP